MISSEAQDTIFAIVNSREDSQIEKKLTKLLEMVLYDSVGLETMEQVSDFARKKQV